MSNFVTVELIDSNNDLVFDFQFKLSDLDKVWFLADLWIRSDPKNNFNLYFE